MRTYALMRGSVLGPTAMQAGALIVAHQALAASCGCSATISWSTHVWDVATTQNIIKCLSLAELCAASWMISTFPGNPTLA